MNRKSFLKTIAAVGIPLMALPTQTISYIVGVRYNFKSIYSNEKLKQRFLNFLTNVFSLYPDKDLHELIDSTTNKLDGDKEIYKSLQSNIGDITPFFSIFTHQLPSLFKQKDIMAQQSVKLLGAETKYDGYLEIGSSGRYLDYLEEKVEITGKRYYADGREPGYSLSEMIDRGQICIGADYIPLADYNTDYAKHIPNESLDLVTVYIGFHHCPLDLRIPFITSIKNTLRKGGKLILRDHDCDSKEQTTLVALAHDVFNMGTHESWEYNEKEVRNFYSLDFICEFIENLGFTFEQKTLFQKGDPTKNALMLFTIN